MSTVEEQIRSIVETIHVGSRIEDKVFFGLFDGLPSVARDDVSQVVETKLIDFFVPDDEQMLYLSLTPRTPSLYSIRLETKPYDYGVITKKGSYYLDFHVIDNILTESSIENQPLTIFVSDRVIPPLVKHYSAGRYGLPEGSRLVTCTTSLDPPDQECEKIFGVPPIISFYRPPGAVTYCCRSNERGFRIPAWMKAKNIDNALNFYDLGALQNCVRVDTGQVGFVDGQYVR